MEIADGKGIFIVMRKIIVVEYLKRQIFLLLKLTKNLLEEKEQNFYRPKQFARISSTRIFEHFRRKDSWINDRMFRKKFEEGSTINSIWF